MLKHDTAVVSIQKTIRTRHAKMAGFTLVEIAIVVMLIGLVCMIAIPSLMRARKNSQAAAIVNDFRVFEGCFDHYAFVNHGTYPPTEMTPGTYPAGMETNWLPETWIGPTPSGGNYAFENGGGTSPNILSVYRPGMDDGLMTRVDEMMDDGVLTTGRILGDADGVDYLMQ